MSFSSDDIPEIAEIQSLRGIVTSAASIDLPRDDSRSSEEKVQAVLDYLGRLRDVLTANTSQYDDGAALVELLNGLESSGGGGDDIDLDSLPGARGMEVRQSIPDPQEYVLPDNNAMFPVKVWRDGPGSPDVGSETTQCNITYTVRTIGATAIDTGGALLGEDMTPLRVRPTVGYMVCPAATGGGVYGMGFYDAVGAFKLYDANETADAEACDEES